MRDSISDIRGLGLSLPRVLANLGVRFFLIGCLVKFFGLGLMWASGLIALILYRWFYVLFWRKYAIGPILSEAQEKYYVNRSFIMFVDVCLLDFSLVYEPAPKARKSIGWVSAEEFFGKNREQNAQENTISNKESDETQTRPSFYQL